MPQLIKMQIMQFQERKSSLNPILKLHCNNNALYLLNEEICSMLISFIFTLMRSRKMQRAGKGLEPISSIHEYKLIIH